MSHFVRRLLGADREEEAPGVTAAAVAAPKPSRPSPTIERLKSYSTERGEAMEGGSEPAQRTRTAERHAHLGDRVGAILKAAEEAADEIRRTAQEEADEARKEAELEITVRTSEAKLQNEAARRQIDQERSQLDLRMQELRQLADSFREKTRRQAEEEARAIREQAEQIANKLQADALRLQKWLEETLSTFHETTGWLESALDGRPRFADTDEASLEEALKPGEHVNSLASDVGRPGAQERGGTEPTGAAKDDHPA
jgi:hypothetical protein